ncbi:malonyl-CoA/methylmalonyl-CoA synthetase [Duganella sp. CF517]|uniref:AMP-binding protein n=1 Tax=Duganella sp. CF517 TaxID=1881038 RepID=UPI0008D5D503|nr:AMP-binding protein [Duganella sp. CF517]SEO09610.1 malonyl-CoA/methylmalonyl-CoA synthetase [Duganella sp. CF517]
MRHDTPPISSNQENDNVFALFEAAAAAHPERAFLVVEGRVLLTYGALLSETARAAAWLRSVGVEPGERALVQVHKSPAAVVLYLACLRAGVVFIPLNTAYQEGELAYFLSDAEPALLAASPGLPAATVAFGGTRAVIAGGLEAAPWAAVEEQLPTVQSASGAPAAILYTSGTTGRSKGAVLTHGNLSSNAKVLGQAWRWRDDDVLLHALPIFHAHGLFVALHCALLHASPMLFHERFDAAAVLRDLPGATVFMGVPTFYTRLLAEPSFGADLCRHIRVFISGSAPLLDATFEEFKGRTGHTILERYGMTEALMVTSNPYDGERIAGSVGPALPGVSVRVVAEGGVPAAAGEPGVLEIKGPNLFAGYWRNPEKTAQDHTADGFFITGDIATQDAAGVVRIVGRSKDLIISGGYNVYPKEIELAIDALDGVVESAVIGVPHPDFGEAVVAVISRAPGAALDPKAITEALATQLASFKRPKKIVIVDELPRNAMGKVQKAELRAVHKDSFSVQSA